MASRIEEFDEKILTCAKKEFLEKGYTDASIRTIAQNAGVSTSTILRGIQIKRDYSASLWNQRLTA